MDQLSSYEKDWDREPNFDYTSYAEIVSYLFWNLKFLELLKILPGGKQ